MQLSEHKIITKNITDNNSAGYIQIKYDKNIKIYSSKAHQGYKQVHIATNYLLKHYLWSTGSTIFID